MDVADENTKIENTVKTTNSNKTNKKKKNTENTEAKKKQQSTTWISIRPESGNAQRDQVDSPTPSPSKRRKSPGVRLVNRRIYDSENGKTCHQCRQKTLDFAVSCSNKTENRQCTLHFCHICLLNRYGEKAEEMAALGDWKCPKCRGICNCSFCMKKRGCCPTGRLVLAAKAIGFSSVSEMLLLKNSDEVGEDAGPSSEKEIASKEEDGVALTKKCRKEDCFKGRRYLKSENRTSGGDDEIENPKTKRLRKNDGSEKETKQIRKDKGASPKKLTSSKELAVASTSGCKRGNYSNGESYSKLPQGIELTNVANIDLPAEDIGCALQFLEFCEAFAKVLDLKEGQSEYLLRELACERSLHRGLDSSIVQFHIKLLALIQKDPGKEYSSFKTGCRNSWFQDLYRCISESLCRSRELLLDCLNLAAEGYGELSSSKKLRLLNFLCDEALGTEELRSWIEEQNLEREKRRNMKMKLQDEVARDILMKNGVPHSVSEHQNLVLKIKEAAAQNLVETLEEKDTERKNAVRPEPILLDGNGRKFWKLRGYSGESDILIQDIGNGNSITFKERWFCCNVFERETIENYISRQPRT